MLGDDEAGHAGAHDLSHRGDVGADGGAAAGHALEQRLPEQLGHLGVLAVTVAVHAREDDRQRPAILLNEPSVVPVVVERDLLPAGEPVQLVEEALVERCAGDIQAQALREALDQVVDALVGHDAAHEERPAGAVGRVGGGEAVGVYPRIDDLGFRAPVVPGAAAAERADMQVGVEQAVGREIRREVVRATPVVGRERTAPAGPGDEGGNLGDEHVALVAVDDVGPQHLGHDRGGDRVEAIAVDVMGAADDSHRQPLDAAHAVRGAEAEQPCRDAAAHMPCELQRVALGAAEDATVV